MRDDFAIFILSHGRANNVITVDTLKLVGYTGKYYIILDNEDTTREQYENIFGKDKIIVIDKLESSKSFDIYDNFEGRNTVTYARNKCFSIARELNLNYFAEFDDDYTTFEFRYEKGTVLGSSKIQNFDAVCEYMIDFLETSNSKVVTFAQGGDMFGGVSGGVWKTKIKRKAMNTFFFKVADEKDDYIFPGRFNEDVNAYTIYGTRGDIILQIANIMVGQKTTQATKGGNTEAYLEYGTYIKSFYSILACPSCIKVGTLGLSNIRFHHIVDWEHCVPKIISSRFKK